MNKVLNNHPPGWFWVISLLLLAWNLLGVSAYLSQVMMSEADLTQAFGPAQAQLAASMPWWATAAFAIAVFAGALGALGLLVRRTWARWMMIASLVAVIVQQFWAFVLAGALGASGAASLALPLATLLICVFEVWLANRGVKRGWLR